MKKLFLTASILGVLATFAGTALAADCDITIGVVMELTGPAGEYGQAGAKSVEMAFRDFNDAGGIGGCKLVTDRPRAMSQSIKPLSSSTSRKCRRSSVVLFHQFQFPF
jgi:branched-chain amino acid transport system substrate-binding protein